MSLQELSQTASDLRVARILEETDPDVLNALRANLSPLEERMLSQVMQLLSGVEAPVIFTNTNES